MAHPFIGGVRIRHAADAARELPLIPLEGPEEVVIPMSMHIGKPCTPCVAVGEHVKLGQKIGECDAPVSAPVHASVSGVVTAIEQRPISLGTMSECVVIRNDCLDTPWEGMVPAPPGTEEDADAIAAAIRAAGIVGMGGATFPTAFKITSGRGKVDTVIINGSECEPFLFSDYRVMLEHPEQVIRGIQLVARACQVGSATLVVERNKLPAIERLEKILPRDGSVRIMGVKTRYPQGAEKQLIHTVTGREVPPGGLPAAVGCNVFNVETCYAVCRAVDEGRPLIERAVTVGGTAMAGFKGYIARIGTPVKYLLEQAGGFAREPRKVIMGGPMMGMALSDLAVPVTKGTNGLLALSGNEDHAGEQGQCLRCGRCAAACPMRLLPTYLYLYETHNDLDALEKYHVTDCIECGSCTYVCPARLPLTHSCKSGKAKLQARNAERKAKEEAAAKEAPSGKEAKG